MEKQALEGNDIFVIHSFMTPEECAALIARTEAIGYGDAPITTAAGPVMLKEVRNNERVMLDDVELARSLFDRARSFLPDRIKGWEVCGFNERFRFYRYDPGQQFYWHRDGCYIRPNGETSALTFMVYLNEGFEGGATAFEHYAGQLDVIPKTGMALVFIHDWCHTGAEVVSGHKYVLRSDVMFRAPTVPPAKESQ